MERKRRVKEEELKSTAVRPGWVPGERNRVGVEASWWLGSVDCEVWLWDTVIFKMSKW